LRRDLWSIAFVVLIAACGAHEPGPVSTPREQSRAKVRFDRAVLTTALDSVQAWHARVNSEWEPAAGARRDEIELRFADASFAVPEELLMVWGRHDGATRSRSYAGGFELLSSVQAHAIFDSLRAEAGAAWRHNWIPVLRAREEIVAVDASRSAAPAGPLVLWSPPAPPRVIATNLTRHLESWSAAIDRGLVRLEGTAVFDHAEMMQLHRTFNDDLPGPWSSSGAPAPR
jgi:hypothetical protein